MEQEEIKFIISKSEKVHNDNIIEMKKNSKLKESIDKIKKFCPSYVFPNERIDANKSLIAFSIKNFNGDGRIFRNVNFNKSALSSSSFRGAKFYACSFQSAALHFSDFSNAKFLKDEDSGIPTTMEEVAFVGTRLINVEMKNLVGTGSDFSLSNLSGAHLIGSEFKDSTFEGAIFDGAQIESMSFEDLNLDYADFNNAQFKDVTVSLMQISTCFGLLKYLVSETGLNVVKDKNGNETELFTKSELYEIIDELLIYYELTGDYFSLCNLLIYYKKDHFKFQKAIIEGLNRAGHERNIRTIKYLSKLISIIYKKDYIAKNKIYQQISKIVNSEADPKLMHEFKIHEGELRATLLPPPSKPVGEIDFILQSKDEENVIKVAIEFIEQLNSLIKLRRPEAEINTIKITKNSPVNIIVSFISDNHQILINILTFTASIITILDMGKKLWNQNRKLALCSSEETSPEHKIDLLVQKEEIRITEGNVTFKGHPDLYSQYSKEIIKTKKIVKSTLNHNEQ